MNLIYLYFHKILVNHADINKVIARKEALSLLKRCFTKGISNSMKETIINEMVEMSLLEKVNRDCLKVIHEEKSKDVDEMIRLRFIEKVRREMYA